MIELKNLTKTYTSRRGVQTHALSDFSLTLPDTGLVFILGKSGSGKSTLLNILGGLDKADSGEVLINGKNIEGYDQKELDFYRNAHVGFVFQDFNIIDTFSIYENVGLALQLQGQEANKERIDKMLDFVDLSGYGKRKGNEVSGGQKQRIAVARALIKDPTIILADEPTGNLDLKTSDQIMHLLKKVSEENLVVVVSHDPEEAEEFGDRIIHIKDGHIIKDIGNTSDKQTSREYPTIHPKLSFIASVKYGVHALSKKKGQLLITNFVVSLSLLFSVLLGAYLSFLNSPNPALFDVLNQAELDFMTRDLLGYLSEDSAFKLLIAMYIIFVSVIYVFLSLSVAQRQKQIGIFKALGANTGDILKIFAWEGIIITLVSGAFSTYLGLAYCLDMNIKFFDALDLLVANPLQLVVNIFALLLITVTFTILLVLSTLKKNSVISILKM